jgi:DNA-binding NarL/FixJ family response regulator
MDKSLKRWPRQQRRVLCKLALGVPVKTIAAMMGLSDKTVEYHRKQIYVRLKLDGKNKDPLVMATRFAIRRKLVRL